MIFSRVSLLTKTLIACSILTLLSIILIDPVWGFYDSFMALLASGSLNNVLLQEAYHLGLRGLIPLLNFLHTQLPAFPWVGIIILISWLFVQTVFVYLMVNSLPRQQITIVHITFTWFLLLLLVFGFSFIEFSITGMGMLLPFAGIVTIYYTIETSNYKKWLALVVSSIAIFIGFGMRMESGIGALILGSIFLLIHEKKPTTWLRVLWLPFLIGIFSLVSYLLSVRQNHFFYKTEPLIFYVTDSKNKPEFKATDSADAVKIEMALSSCLIDSSVVNHAFFDRLKEEKKQYEKQILLHPVEILLKIKEVIAPSICSYKIQTTTVALIVVMSLIMAFTGGNQRQLIQITLFNLALLSVICFLAYSMKMEGWHFIPLMQIVALGNMLFLRRELLSNILKSQVFIITLLFFSVIFLFHLIKENRSNHDSINEKITLQSQIENLYKDKYLFYDVGTRELLDNYVFRLFKKRDNIYFYDLAQLVYLNEFAQQLNRLCQCNSFMPVEFLNFLKNNDRVKYISTPHRVEIIERYMSVIHDFKVHFVQRQEVQLNNVKHAQAIKKLGVYQVQ